MVQFGCSEDPGGLDEGFNADTVFCLSSVMFTEGATAAGRSEVDGFAEGGGEVCFSEGLWHRLQDDEQKKKKKKSSDFTVHMYGFDTGSGFDDTVELQLAW